MNFRCAKASATKSRAAGTCVSSVGPLLRQQERDGVEQHRRPAFELLVGRRSTCRRSPSTPPTSGATSFEHRPFRLRAPCRSAARTPASTPSVTSAPTLRPAKLFGPFLMMLSAGDGFRSCARRPGGVGRLAASSFSRRPLATVSASACVDVAAGATTIRARIAGVSTLLSSNVSALAMWRCSTRSG